jgi:hypothetical protein
MVDKIKELELEQAAENQSLETILATAIDESTKVGTASHTKFIALVTRFLTVVSLLLRRCQTP